MMQTVAERTEGAEPAKGAEPSGVAEPADRAPSPGGLWAPERRSLSLGLYVAGAAMMLVPGEGRRGHARANRLVDVRDRAGRRAGRVS